MIKKVFKKMLLTQILSAMTVTLCMLIDSIMIGQFLGVDSMTAYGLSTPLLLVFAALGAMMAAGVQVVCGHTMGKGDKNKTDGCFSLSLLLSVGISVIGLALIITIPNAICTLLGAGDPVETNKIFFLTRGYLRGFIAGAPAFIFAQIMVPYVQIAGEQKRLVIAVSCMTISDVIFDLLNVYVFRGGMLGMGLASSFSYYIAVIIGLTYFVSKKSIFHFRIKKVSTAILRSIVKNGIPTVINQVSLVLLVYVFNRILLDVGGNLSVAAYSVVSTVSNICYSFGAGVGAVALTLASIFYADEDRTSLYTLIKTMTKYAIVLDIIVTIVVLIAAPVLVRLFLDNPSAESLARLGVRLFSLCLVPCSLNTSLKNFYQGTNKVRLTQIISVLQNFALIAVFAFILSRFFATTGVWLAFVCGESMTLILILLYVFSKNKKVSLRPEEFALLHDDFGVPGDECLEISINSKADVSKASAAASEFCKAHGEDDKIAMYVSLCIVEIADNILSYGFKGDNNIDIRYMKKNNKRTLRIRDDCEHFDPIAYMKLHKADYENKNNGIRMVTSMASKASYVNSLGLNNLTLTF